MCQYMRFWNLALYSMITPFDAFEIYYAFENIMENGAFAPKEYVNLSLLFHLKIPV